MTNNNHNNKLIEQEDKQLSILENKLESNQTSELQPFIQNENTKSKNIEQTLPTQPKLNVLYQERTNKNLTLNDISEVLKIRICYLDAIEKSKWEELPERVYAIGFLNSYANYLNVDPSILSQDLIKFLDKTYDNKIFLKETSKERILYAQKQLHHLDLVETLIEFLKKNNWITSKYSIEFYKNQILYSLCFIALCIIITMLLFKQI